MRIEQVERASKKRRRNGYWLAKEKTRVCGHIEKAYWINRFEVYYQGVLISTVSDLRTAIGTLQACPLRRAGLSALLKFDF